jgi:hypothetical protein
MPTTPTLSTCPATMPSDETAWKEERSAAFSTQPPLRFEWRHGCPRQDTIGTPFSSTRIDLVGLPQPVPHTDKLPMARHGRKAMAGGCANGHAQWLGSPEPGAQQLKHEVKRKPPLQEDVCYRLMIHKPASCRVKTGRWVPNLSPEKCLLHGMALPGTSTPSIRPSGSLASPSMSLGADNTLEHPCRRRHPS